VPIARRLPLLLLLLIASLATLAGPALATEADDPGPGVLFGTIRSADGPVEGIDLVITGPDGDEVATVTTGENGGWEAEVDEPGEYTVTLVEDSLPEGVALRDPEAATKSTTVQLGARRTVVFPLGEGSAGRGFLAGLAQQATNGLKFGLIIAMTAIGLSLIFGTTGLINFAHSELVVFGAILTWFFNARGPELHLVPAAVLGVIASGLLGGGLDLGLFRPLRRRRVGLFQLLVITIGLGLVLRFGLLVFFGGSPRTYADFVGQTRIAWGPISQTPRDFAVMGLSVLVLIAVATMLQRTRIGKAMRAVADNRDLAESSGIDVQRVILVVWALGAALAGLGGIFYGTTIAVDYLFGFRLLLLMFAGVILGGLGTAYGAMVGSILVGLVTELSVVWFPNELKYAWGLAVLVIVLLVRPQGILGTRERIG
jgi:neutral amino acid transport system permease protein